MRPWSVQPCVVLLCVGQAALGFATCSSQQDSQRVDLRVELEQPGVSGRVSHGGAWWPSHSQGSVSSTAGAGSLSIDAATLPSHPRHELQLIWSKPQHPLFPMPPPLPCAPSHAAHPWHVSSWPLSPTDRALAPHSQQSDAWQGRSERQRAPATMVGQKLAWRLACVKVNCLLWREQGKGKFRGEKRNRRNRTCSMWNGKNRANITMQLRLHTGEESGR